MKDIEDIGMEPIKVSVMGWPVGNYLAVTKTIESDMKGYTITHRETGCSVIVPSVLGTFHNAQIAFETAKALSRFQIWDKLNYDKKNNTALLKKCGGKRYNRIVEIITAGINKDKKRRVT